MPVEALPPSAASRPADRETAGIARIREWWRFTALACLLLAAYWNHFDNSFHFDDFHTVVNNGRVHSLSNWQDWFVDPAAFSVLTTHQVFRPLVSASLAVDWALAGGATPRWFHISTFTWLLVLAVTLRALFGRLLGSSGWGWFAASLFVLHPVAAETVNYTIQRGDLYATLGISAALWVFAAYPERRRMGLYLLPFAAGALSKTTALIFPLLLGVYLYLYERRSWRAVCAGIAPAVAVTAALGWWAARMTGSGFAPGATHPWLYRATQGSATWHYFASFFWPMGLTADTDMTVASSFLEPRVILGAVFVAALTAAAILTARRLRDVSFGLSWFLIALLPTAVMPLAEVANDHRMFMAFPGLCLAACRLALAVVGPTPRRPLVLAAAGLLAVLAAGTHERNKVWRTEETLWRDVTIKSPANGRGLMNYGLTLMNRGQTQEALGYFERATVFTPRYPLLEINRAIARGVLGQAAEAEGHFRQAIAWSPQQSTGYFYFGRWLWHQKRQSEAAANLRQAVALNPSDFQARALLADVHAGRQEWGELRQLIEETLRLAPADATALGYRQSIAERERQAAQAQSAADAAPTPESYLESSLAHFRAGRYLECVHAAERALALRPGYAEAYNNIAAGYNALHRWDEGVKAASEAVRLRPDWDLARNNLNHARAQRAAALQARPRP